MAEEALKARAEEADRNMKDLQEVRWWVGESVGGCDGANCVCMCVVQAQNRNAALEDVVKVRGMLVCWMCVYV